MHVPEGWSITKLEEISEIRSGSTPLRSKGERYFSNDGIPWVKTLDLNNARIEDTEEKITDLALQETSCSVFPVDTVLVAMYGGFNQIGRTGVLGMPAAINQALSALIIDNSKALSQYVLYFLNGNVKRWKQFAASSRKDPNITQSDVKNFAILLPPLAEQEKIAEILSTWDDAIEQTERLKANAETHKKALMQQLLTGKKRFPEFWGEWVEHFLKDLEDKQWMELGRGKVISQKDIQQVPGDYPVYSSSVQNNGLMGKYGEYMFDEELITWSVDGGGNFFYRNKHKFSVTNVSGYMRIDTSKLNYQFLANQLIYLHRRFHFDYQTKAHPSVIRRLYKVVIPPLEEQQKIASVLNTADQEIELLTQKIEHLKSEKRALMQQLLTGKRRIKVDG